MINSNVKLPIPDHFESDKKFKNPDLEIYERDLNFKKPTECGIAREDKRIKFLGFVPNGELHNFYSSLDVFVFPSLLEGYGLPIVEAMACGKPVVTLTDAIIPSDVKSRTHICTLEELPRVLVSREFNCDCRANLRFAREHSWKKLVDETVEVYERVMS